MNRQIKKLIWGEKIMHESSKKTIDYSRSLLEDM